jgi:hypothetical protein
MIRTKWNALGVWWKIEYRWQTETESRLGKIGNPKFLVLKCDCTHWQLPFDLPRAAQVVRRIPDDAGAEILAI